MSTVVTSGIWRDVSENLPRITGLNSQQISWGRMTKRSRLQSAYSFNGRKTPLRLDGEEFVLGTFTHNNFPIKMGRVNSFSVKLEVSVAFDEGNFNRTFTFNMHHTETLNRGSREQSADRVLLSSVISRESVLIDGKTYAVEIVGFKQNGAVVKEFISYEDSANSAVIVAKLVDISDTVEPPVSQEQITYTFNVLNPDGSIYGKGCFSYQGEEEPIDIAHIIGEQGEGTKLTAFHYNDPLVGSLNLEQLLSLNFISGDDIGPSRFTLNAANVPDDNIALAGGIATPEQLGSLSIHRHGSEVASCGGRKITFPTPCYYEEPVAGGDEQMPVVDLVVVMDSSTSMRPEAIKLSDAIDLAIVKAKKSCPSDLRVSYLGLEGRFSKTLFDNTIRKYLIELGIDESQMRGRKRGSVDAGGAQEDGARAIEDVATFFDWRKDAKRALFFLGDEGMEGGDLVNEDDIEAATEAIDVANTHGVVVHTYFANSNAEQAVVDLNKSEFERVATGTGGEFFTGQESLGEFQTMLEKVICASKGPAGTLKPCPCTQQAIEEAVNK